MLQTLVEVAVPLITFLLLALVGSSLTPAAFARVPHQPVTVGAGLLAPLVLLPFLAIGLVEAFQPPMEIEAGLILIAACPIRGISTTYNYLAGASTALSVVLTALSSLLAVASIPLLDRVFEVGLGRPFGFRAPTGLLLAQLVAMLALPLAVGMGIRHRWPGLAERHRKFLQQLGFGALGGVLVIVIASEAPRFVGGLSRTVPLALAFILSSMLVGWLVSAAIGADAADRFTLVAEFATRNVAIATAIAVTLLDRIEFAVFATTYFLTEIPVMLAAIAVFRASQQR